MGLIVSACSGDPSRNYSISVEYFPIKTELRDADDSTDYSSGIVSIFRVDVSEPDEEILNELVVSPFRNGKVELRGETEQPIWVEIHVKSEKTSTPLISRTLVEPGENVALALVDFNSAFADDNIVHIGSLSIVEDPSKKFTISADLSSQYDDSSTAIANVVVNSWNEKGDREWETVCTIIVQNGKFSAEIEVDAPLVMEVYVDGFMNGNPTHYSQGIVIAEPGTSIILQPSRRTQHASANLSTGWFEGDQDPSEQAYGLRLESVAGSERHAKLLESWNQSFTYLLRQEQWKDARDAHWDQIEQLDFSNYRFEETIDTPQGCKHVDLSQVRPERSLRWNTRIGSKYEELEKEIQSIRRSALSEIAHQSTDPFDILLALELQEWNSIEEREEAIETYEKLTRNVSQDLIDRRIEPAVSYLAAVNESEVRDGQMVPGQQVPDFDLPNHEGTVQNFYDILKANDLVYMVFFRRAPLYGYGGPAFERFRLLHESYGHAGLQIVPVTFGVDSDQLENIASADDITWIPLFDPQAYSVSDVAKVFATVHQSASYLIDSKGCIVQRNLTHDVLDDFLQSHFLTPTSEQ